MKPKKRIYVLFSLIFLVIFVLTLYNCGGDNGEHFEVTITVKNISPTTKNLRLSIRFSKQGTITYTKNFIYNSPINSTMVETFIVSEVYDTYSLSADVALDMNNDNNANSKQEIAIDEATFSDAIIVDFGLPSSITVNNIPETTTQTRLNFVFSGQGITYSGVLNFSTPFDPTILETLNIVAGI